MKPEERVSILAVDDHPAKLLALTTVLAELNQNVVTASSGREALRFLLQQEFAVVLLDVHMPTMDGFETAALMRQRESSEHTPIIFVTSYPDDTHAARGYSLGAVERKGGPQRIAKGHVRPRLGESGGLEGARGAAGHRAGARDADQAR